MATHKWGDPSHIRRHFQRRQSDVFVANEYEPQVKRLIFVGQWLPPKGIRYLAEAFNELCMLHSDLELWCVGTLRDGEAVKAIFPPAVRDRVVVRHAWMLKLCRRSTGSPTSSFSPRYLRALARPCSKRWRWDCRLLQRQSAQRLIFSSTT